MRGWRRVGRVVWHGLALAGLLLGGPVAALASGVPIGVDEWVDVTDAPVPAHRRRAVCRPDGQRIGRDTPLLVVTSRYHSRRALLSFSRAGFTHVRIIGHYEARRGAGSRRPLPGSPAALRSSVPGYAPSGRVYDDVLFRLAHRSRDALLSVRELGAMLLEQPTIPPHD